MDRLGVGSNCIYKDYKNMLISALSSNIDTNLEFMERMERNVDDLQSFKIIKYEIEDINENILHLIEILENTPTCD